MSVYLAVRDLTGLPIGNHQLPRCKTGPQDYQYKGFFFARIKSKNFNAYFMAVIHGNGHVDYFG